MGRRGIRTAEFVAITLLLIVPVVILITAMANRDIEREYPAFCANNLKQLGLALKMYSNESRGGYYPPVGYYRQPVVDCDDPEFPETGDLSQVYTGFMHLPAIYPEYMPDPIVTACPQDPNFPEWRDRFDDAIYTTFPNEYDKVCLQPNRGVESLLQSYTYFGYASGPKGDEPIAEPSYAIPDELANLGELMSSNSQEHRLPVRVALYFDLLYQVRRDHPDELGALLDSNIDFSERYDVDSLPENIKTSDLFGYHDGALFRQRVGMTRLWQSDFSGPGRKKRMHNVIPILAERITRDTESLSRHSEKSKLGGNVLYLDGHVEWVDYAPENFPISPGMALLHESIDASPVFQKRF